MLATPGFAASFNCAKVGTPQEKAICASPNLSAADDGMAAAYRTILHTVPPSFQEEVRADQRVWVRRLATECPANNPEQRLYLETCILARENARSDALKQRLYKQDGITFAWHSIYRETPGEPGAEDPGEGPGSLEVSWPEALSNSPEWTSWNNAIAHRALTIAGLARLDSPIPPSKNWEASPGMDANIATSLDFVNSQQVTATITCFWDGHGAHPGTHWLQFNWLLHEERNLHPEDMFRSNSNWADVLYSSTDQYLHKTLENYDPAEVGKALPAITANPENWQIDEKGISIIFQQYAVSCYACTPPPFTIPWAQIRPLLNPNLIVPVKR
jgi:uncharacterized protein YecT (DUF1311 family)